MSLLSSPYVFYGFMLVLLGGLGVAAWYGFVWFFQKRETVYGISPSRNKIEKRTLPVNGDIVTWEKEGEANDVAILLDGRFAVQEKFGQCWFANVDTGKVFFPAFPTKEELERQASEEDYVEVSPGEYVNVHLIDGHKLQNRIEDVSEQRWSEAAREDHWLKDLVPYMVVLSFLVLCIVAYYVWKLSQRTPA